MSKEKAQLWLQKHSDTIPAIKHNHQKIINLLEHEHKSQDIVLCAANDPGLSLALLKKVNTSRGAKSGRDIVESTRSAISLLGDQVTHTLLKDFPVAENILDNPQQIFLFQQIINRSFHNELQLSNWASENGYQQIEQLKSCALLTYSGEALCCVHDFENYLNYIKSGSLDGSEQQYFGFSFPQLTESLCQNLNLPEIIIDSQPHKNSRGQRENFLNYISRLCHQSEQGWYSETQQKTFQQFADFLQQPVDSVVSKFHQISIQAARQSILQDAWQAAGRLILIQDQAWTPPADPKQVSINEAKINAAKEEIKTTKKDDVFIRIKKLLKQDNVSQSDILNSCLNGMVDDLSMSKVCLLLLSKDQQVLHNRMSLGLDKDSPFRQYQIEVNKSGLLKILLKKPQAIWINSNSFKKYQHLIPQSLLAGIMTNNFLAMSLFIGNKPTGIIYTDRTGSSETLDEQVFTQYKQLISLTSKALTFLAKK